jgi:hypothetical protein
MEIGRWKMDGSSPSSSSKAAQISFSFFPPQEKKTKKENPFFAGKTRVKK